MDYRADILRLESELASLQQTPRRTAAQTARLSVLPVQIKAVQTALQCEQLHGAATLLVNGVQQQADQMMAGLNQVASGLSQVFDQLGIAPRNSSRTSFGELARKVQPKKGGR